MKTDLKTFAQDVLESPVPVLVDFYATWCGPCQMLGPVLEETAKNYQGRARVVKVDIDESPELASRYEITAVPTLLVFQGGQVVGKAMGFQSPRQLTNLLDKALARVPA